MMTDDQSTVLRSRSSKATRGPVLNRRTLIAGAAGGAMLSSAFARPAPSRSKVVTQTPFAKLLELAPNVWAVASTPVYGPDKKDLATLTTFCNGGLIAGEDKLVAIEGFYTPEGAAWLSSAARALTGREITDVIITHLHADHTGGLAGYQCGADGPEIIGSDTTRKLIFERYASPSEPVAGTPFSAPEIRPLLPTRIITDETKEVTLDLGGREITIDPKSGHSPSDLVIRINDASVVFAGDLVWADYFHNYIDAIPTKLRKSASRILENEDAIIVTGHGSLGRGKDLKGYLNFLDYVEDAARRAIQIGKSPDEAAAEFAIPASLGEWKLFNSKFVEFAFAAWRRELEGAASQ